MILLIDNYDSFTYNLVQRIGELDPSIELHVYRNDKITPTQAQKLNPSHIIISPGPCTPKQGGVSNDIIKHFASKIPILGVCLGHQCIAHSHGMTVQPNYRLMHGKTSPIHHDGKSIFKNLPNPFTATRYHSLIINRSTIDQAQWNISAWTEENEVMAIRKKYSTNSPQPQQPIEGVQFHPESFLSIQGPSLLANFLNIPQPITN